MELCSSCCRSSTTPTGSPSSASRSARPNEVKVTWGRSKVDEYAGAMFAMKRAAYVLVVVQAFSSGTAKSLVLCYPPMFVCSFCVFFSVLKVYLSHSLVILIHFLHHVDFECLTRKR